MCHVVVLGHLQFELLAYDSCWGSVANVTVNGAKQSFVYDRNTNQAGER
jgi:hypothetical protein